MAIIKAPVPITGFNANVSFVNGVAETTNPWLINWFRSHGYEVSLEEDEAPKADRAGLTAPGQDLSAMTVEALREYAQSIGVKVGAAYRKKADVIGLIEQAEKAGEQDESDGDPADGVPADGGAGGEDAAGEG